MRPIDKVRLAERLTVTRERAGLTQSQVALAIGVTQPTVCGWEGAVFEPKREMWSKLAAALGTTIEALFFDTDDTAAAS